MDKVGIEGIAVEDLNVSTLARLASPQVAEICNQTLCNRPAWNQHFARIAPGISDGHIRHRSGSLDKPVTVPHSGWQRTFGATLMMVVVND